MGIDDYLTPDDDKLDQQDVAEEIEEHTGVKPIQASNGPRFYAEKLPNGEGKTGTLFAMVHPGPRLYVDPTAKNGVPGITPAGIRQNDMFERVTHNYGSSFGYSVMLENELPEEVIAAVEWSYERFLTVT
jgi:hypothetical protein